MFSMRWQFVVLLAVIVFLCGPIAGFGQESQTQNPVATAAPSLEAAALAEVPMGQAVVSYENSELTIKSRSAPLIEVLRAVCSQIGADLDAPPEADEIVLGVAGPGPARKVLASMLDGSPYDLATSGSAEDPNALSRVVVIRKSKESAAQENKGPTENKDTADTSRATTEAAVVTQPQMDSIADADDVVVKPNMQQVLELLGQAKSEIIVDGDGNSREMASALQEVEAQVKAAAAVESQGGSAQPVVPQSGTAVPIGRPIMHRRR
jgi:hypothetical protein